MALIKDWVDPRTGESLKDCYLVLNRYEIIKKRLHGKISVYISKEAYDNNCVPVEEVRIDKLGENMMANYDLGISECSQLYLIAKEQFKDAIDDEVYFAAKAIEKQAPIEEKNEQPIDEIIP
jgi:hypothetical protein